MAASAISVKIMGNKKAASHSGSGFFLLEIMLSVFMLILCVAVCISLFAASRLISKKTLCTDQAVQLLSGLAEQYIATDTKSFLQEISVYYDGEFSPASDDASADYLLEISVTGTDIERCEFTLVDISEDEMIYEMYVEKLI